MATVNATVLSNKPLERPRHSPCMRPYQRQRRPLSAQAVRKSSVMRKRIKQGQKFAVGFKPRGGSGARTTRLMVLELTSAAP